MTASKTATRSKSKGNREAQRERTRGRMLQAVLDIVVDKGMRSVRHREVAERAGVSLGSTTYHFSTIEDLIISAFDYFNKQKMLTVNPYYLEVQKRMTPYEGTVVPESLRPELAAWIFKQSADYVCDQVDGRHRYDRLVEFAFYHESIRYPSLRDQLIQVRQIEQSYLTKVHRMMGSPQPGEDARVTAALFRQLEQSVFMAVPPGVDEDVIRRTIHRHLSVCLDIPLPPVAAAES